MNLREDRLGKYFLFTFLSIVTAGSNMGVVYIINQIIKNYFADTPLLVQQYLIYYLVLLLLFFTSRWIVSISLIRFTQKLLRTIRIGVLQVILRFPFHSMVKNKAQIFTALTRDTDNVVYASTNIVDILTNSVVVVICFIYMGVLSWKLLLCMLLLVSFTLSIYYYSEKRARSLFDRALKYNDIFVRYLNEILSGFKEIVMDRRKGREIAEKYVNTSIHEASALYQKAQINFMNNRIIGQITFYLFIGVLLLFLGQMFGIEKSVVVNFIFLILYVWGPIETVVLLTPNLTQARMSLKRLTVLESKVNESSLETGVALSIKGFNTVSLVNVSYRYEPEDGAEHDKPFGIGPVDFRLNAGDIAFICGGNGSGKTTFVNVLIGLFRYDKGEICVDNEKIGLAEMPAYRSLFAPVFSDFHLFDECYGIAHVDMVKAEEYLGMLEIKNKVSMAGRKFSTINLSAGQRKRLALFCAMIERKPILILDEFAADQDPQFREKFYKVILPYLKEEGFTVIAITHDDHYYGYAEHLYKMEDGLLHRLNFKARSQIIDIQ